MVIQVKCWYTSMHYAIQFLCDNYRKNSYGPDRKDDHRTEANWIRRKRKIEGAFEESAHWVGLEAIWGTEFSFFFGSERFTNTRIATQIYQATLAHNFMFLYHKRNNKITFFFYNSSLSWSKAIRKTSLPTLVQGRSWSFMPRMLFKRKVLTT